jgi:hypothetical protein
MPNKKGVAISAAMQKQHAVLWVHRLPRTTHLMQMQRDAHAED